MTGANTRTQAAGPGSAPGFAVGFTTLFTSFRWLLLTPKYWLVALVPSAVLLVLLALAIVLSSRGVYPWAAALLPETDAWLVNIGRKLLPWFAALTASLIGFWFAFLLTPLLAAPALERLVRARERALHSAERASLGFFAELACGLRAQVAALVLSLPLLSSLTVLELVFPLLAPLTLGFKYVTVALVLAWNLLDYPLTLRGIGLRQRWNIFRAHLASVLGFATAVSLLFWFPCCSVLMLPVGVIAATDLALQFLKYDAAFG